MTLAWLQEAIVIPGVLANASVDCKSFQRKKLLSHLPTLCHTGTFFPHSCVNVLVVKQKRHTQATYQECCYPVYAQNTFVGGPITPVNVAVHTAMQCPTVLHNNDAYDFEHALFSSDALQSILYHSFLCDPNYTCEYL